MFLNIYKTRKTDLEFYVDRLDEHAITGWAWIPSTPDRRVIVELLANGEVVAETVADKFREDLRMAAKGDGNCAFTLTIPDSLRTGNREAIALRVQGREAPFFEDELVLTPPADTNLPCQFCVDRLDEHEIMGWAWIPSTPDRRVIVELLANGEVVAETVADKFREDLRMAAKGDGNCAFTLTIPDRLRDGYAYDLSLRAKGTEAAFVDLGQQRFATLEYSFDRLTPLEIAGTCWVAGIPGTGNKIEIEALLNGTLIGQAISDALHCFSMTSEPAALKPLLSGVEPGEDRSLVLEIKANDLTIQKVEFLVSLSKSGGFALFFQEISQERLAMQALDLTLGMDRELRLDLDGMTSLEAAPSGLHQISLDLGTLSLADGNHEFELFSVSEEGEAILEASIPFDYARWDVEIGIEDDQVTGRITDHWTGRQEPAVELLIDNRALGVTPAKRVASSDKRIFDVAFPIAAQFRDGKPHRAALRLIGTEALWPDRGVLFTAGSQDTFVLARAEYLGDAPRGSHGTRRISGFALAPWAAQASLEVTLQRGTEVLSRQTADRLSQVLAAEQALPQAHGFEFDLLDQNADLAEEPLKIVISLEGDPLCERLVTCLPETAFTVRDPGFGREGACFVISEPYASLDALEETRAILLAAANLAREANAPITVVLAYPGAENRRGDSIEDWIVDLIGKRNAQDLATACFVYLPAPVLASTATGAQDIAYRLDLWVRACDFSLVLGPSGGGVMAYCAQSRQEGLLTARTRIAVFVEGFTVEARLRGEHLLDDPGLLTIEALERLSLRGADDLLAHRPQAVSAAAALWPGAAEKADLLSPDLGTVQAEPLGCLAPSPTQWLVVAGPLSTAAGIGVICDTLDRLARQIGTGIGSEGGLIGVAFLGSEGDLRGARAGDYIRKRAKAWPFEVRLHVDLAFDSMRDALADFAGRGLGIMPQGHLGAPWGALLASVGVATADLSDIDTNNPSALASRLAGLLGDDGDIPNAASSVASTSPGHLGARLVSMLEDKPSSDVAEADALPPLSVCISHFNRPTLLRQTLASLRNCAYPDLEVIVVDDGSQAFGVSDELDEIAESYDDIGVRIVRQANSYLGAARNTAMRNATRDMIVFMDDDNIAHPDMLHGFVAVQRATEADIVTARFAFFDETDDAASGEVIPRELGVPLTPDLGVGMFANGFGDANMMVRRAAFEKVGGFSEDYGVGHEDWEFFARSRMLGLRHSLSNRVLFHYRVAAHSMLRGRERIERDKLRNIRAYNVAPAGPEQAAELYRVALLAQGLIDRWNKPAAKPLPAARPGLAVAHRLAFGRVAVIMRTKDRPLLLARAIDSVLGQTMTDWALVIVNDGGDSAPVQALLDARKAALQGRAMLINNPSSTGMENASNAGITNSTSEFLVIHDDDDAWDPDFLRRCVTHLDRVSPDIGGVVTHATVVVEDIEGDRIIERSRHLFKNTKAVELAKMSVENQFPPISFLFRRSAMETVGQFDGTLPVLGDWDFHLRMAKRYRIDVIAEPLAYYHHRTAGTTSQYGNTVIAQRDSHQFQRAHYINRHMRAALEGLSDGTPQGNTGGDGSGPLLYQGEMHREVIDNLLAIRDHIGWLEKMIKDRADHLKYVEDLINKKS